MRSRKTYVNTIYVCVFYLDKTYAVDLTAPIGHSLLGQGDAAKVSPGGISQKKWTSEQDIISSKFDSVKSRLRCAPYWVVRKLFHGRSQENNVT